MGRSRSTLSVLTTRCTRSCLHPLVWPFQTLYKLNSQSHYQHFLHRILWRSWCTYLLRVSQDEWAKSVLLCSLNFWSLNYIRLRYTVCRNTAHVGVYSFENVLWPTRTHTKSRKTSINMKHPKSTSRNSTCCSPGSVCEPMWDTLQTFHDFRYAPRVRSCWTMTG